MQIWIRYFLSRKKIIQVSLEFRSFFWSHISHQNFMFWSEEFGGRSGKHHRTAEAELLVADVRCLRPLILCSIPAVLSLFLNRREGIEQEDWNTDLES